MTVLLGPPGCTATQARAWAMSHGCTDQFAGLAVLYWAMAGGARPDVCYAQAAKETGFGRYGGTDPVFSADPTFHNFCGLKTADGAATARFPSDQVGVLAHWQHLSLYAGAPGFPVANPIDPRHFAFLAGRAPTVEALGGQWAPDPAYGASVVNDYLTPMEAYNMTETWLPFATIERGPYDDGAHGGPVQAHDGAVEHVTTNWVDPGPYFAQVIHQASSHLWIRRDGLVVQYLPLEVASWAQSAGNYSYVSIETDGTVDVPLSDQQVSSFARVYAAVERLAGLGGFGFGLAETPGDKGLGWHGMGGAAWGGHFGCPGDLRKGQRPAILAMAQGQGGDMPNDTDVTDAWVPPPGHPDFGSTWQVQWNGGVETLNGSRFYGSYLSLPPAARQGVRHFPAISGRADGKPGYVLFGDDGSHYQMAPAAGVDAPAGHLAVEIVDHHGNRHVAHVIQP